MSNVTAIEHLQNNTIFLESVLNNLEGSWLCYLKVSFKGTEYSAYGSDSDRAKSAQLAAEEIASKIGWENSSNLRIDNL